MSYLERLRQAVRNVRSEDRRVLRIATAVWAGLTIVHITIWTMVSVIGGGLDHPWWLAFTVPLGLLIGAAWWISQPRRV